MFGRQIIRLSTRSVYARRTMSSTASPKAHSFTKIVVIFSSIGAVAAVGYNTSEAILSSIKVDDHVLDKPKIDEIKKEIGNFIEKDSIRRGDGTSIGPTLIRLAWHASGTYSAADGTGGSNGATMRFLPESGWGANAGLQTARDFLEPLKAKYPTLSYADLWTLAGVTAVEEMGGPKISWRPGRTDSLAPTTVPNGRLPSADSGCVAADVAHLRSIFGRMGFSDREIVALTGAHAVGRCHPEASGYWGPWTNAETTFSNEYFRLLLEENWTEKKIHNGKKWEGPTQYENSDGSLMMLPADLSLAKSAEFRPFVELYAKDEPQFFEDFASAFAKLLELGVKFPEKKKGFFASLFGF